jgi:RNA polymerase sigma-70 factor (ECF subfamily)
MPPDLETLWRDQGVDLQRFIRVLGASHAEAEDCAQEAFLQAIKTPPAPGNTAAWLRTVAKNAYLKSLRKTRKIAPVDMATIEQDWAAVVGEDSQATVDALKQCISLLNDKERRALHLRYTMNASREVMAEDLGLSDGGVKNLLERAKAKLKECVERKTKGV